ncbi:hypothetical protein [Limnohabitans sp. JirII-31]|uniref:hypothetical protein n=1 Tax=Limnohabitans sp. JirII-31 TaxID=1977908 RepID=UPI00117A50F4|nr:hypothetical protein [Limnohabitans sp. JirII-31]
MPCHATPYQHGPIVLRIAITGDIIATMDTATKLLNAMRQNPNDWVMARLLTVPAHRPIKAIYIKRFVALIDQIQE